MAQRRFKTAALAVASNPGIQRCEPMSVLKAVCTRARLSLSPAPAVHHGAIVPFKTAKPGKSEATL
ncbi:hypothetical protein R0J87_25405, partial [Halomonas sp. SIMBA_159]